MKVNIKLLLLFFTFLFFAEAKAQVSDDFNDGDFLNAPSWFGDIDSFQVVNGELRNKGNGSGNGKGALVVAMSNIANTEWRLRIKFNFNPSSSNFCRFYLTSDQADLKGNLLGYYVQLGGSTGTSDSISVYKQNGSLRSRIIAGRAGTVGKTQNVLDLKIIRDSTGGWSLFSDTALTGNFVLEGLGSDTTFNTSAFTGVFCQYTSSNAQGFYFDNFYAGPILMDSAAPVFDSIVVKNANSAEVFFGEELEQVTAEDGQNYIVNGGIGNPVSAILSANKKSVVLTFSVSFPLGQVLLLTCDGIKDLSSNVSGPQTKSFTYYIAQQRDVLINELFPDPSPQVGLPGAEFIELYNRSFFPLNLSGWTITDGTTISTLPNFTLKPDSFVILCPSTNAIEYAIYGTTIGVSSFPSLNNSGDKITLKNQASVIIDEVEYTLSWYNDGVKDDGGWSLELINPNHPCSGKNNWNSSGDAAGGTPGKKNSVYSAQADVNAPVIGSYQVINSGSVLLVFNEHIDTASSRNYTLAISNGINVVTKQFLGAEHDSLLITIAPNFTSGITYQLIVSGIRDCWGNQLINGGFMFKYLVPSDAVNYGVLIDEIYADETPSHGLPDAEYVELYNRMQVPVSLEGWTFSDGSTTSILPKFILEPDSFVVVCASSKSILFNSGVNVLGVGGFPSLGNDGELLVLKDQYGKLIHSVEYSSNWYQDNIKKNGGWSLEMRDVMNPCGGGSNWKACVAVIGGTPGKINSIQGNNPDLIKPELLRVYPISNKQIILVFSEPIDSVSASNFSGYFCTQLLQPVSVSFPSDALTKVALTFNDSIKVKTVYEIRVDSVRDCAGNLIKVGKNKARFGMYESADSLDILINEILFNPLSGGSDFVELYNHSSKIINVNDVFLANTDANNAINDYYRIFNEPFLLFPSEYLAISEDEVNVKLNYRAGNLMQITTMPGFSDDEGTVVLMDSAGKRYDQFNYAASFHNPLIDTKDGVSLERIDFAGSTQDRNNWTSASSTSGFATPGYQNSQHHYINEGGLMFQLEKESFSPNGDGFDDKMLITYHSGFSGYSCSIRIFTSQGYLVKNLIRNEVLGTEGLIKWDGDTENGNKASTGIYVLLIELVNTKGEKKEFKKTVVLASRL